LFLIGIITTFLTHFLNENSFQAINNILPEMARKRVEDIIVETQDAIFRLENAPENTLEFVDYLNFFDTFVDRIDTIGRTYENLKDLYSLIKTYNVPTSPEDLAVYKVNLKARVLKYYFSFFFYRE